MSPNTCKLSLRSIHEKAHPPCMSIEQRQDGPQQASNEHASFEIVFLHNVLSFQGKSRGRSGAFPQCHSAPRVHMGRLPWIIRIRIDARASTRSTWMNPPMVYPLISPRAQNNNNTTNIVQSMMSSLRLNPHEKRNYFPLTISALTSFLSCPSFCRRSIRSSSSLRSGVLGTRSFSLRRVCWVTVDPYDGCFFTVMLYNGKGSRIRVFNQPINTASERDTDLFLRTRIWITPLKPVLSKNHAFDFS